MASKVPRWLAGRLLAVVALAGLGAGGVHMAHQQAQPKLADLHQAQTDPYVVAVAADLDTSAAVKVAMVMGHYYESSGKHIGWPYVDRLGRGQPLTVCNGITGQGVHAGRYYTPEDCYQLEKKRYIASERDAKQVLQHWRRYDAFVQAVFIDFVHNKGSANLRTSSMLRKANAGDLIGACAENPRWNKGTVNGVRTVLPGLQLRGEANAELCASWRLEVSP